MRRSNIMFLLLGLSIIFFGCSKEDYLPPELDQSDQAASSLKAAKKPAPNLIGEMNLEFNTLFIFPGGINGPTWEGTIDIEGHGVYGLIYYPLGEQKGFSQASPFEEYFAIYDLGTGDKYLEGYDSGVTTLANKPPDPCKFRGNGEIVLAISPFEDWIGRKVHMSGSFTWQPFMGGIAPYIATGTLRIN